MWFCNIQLQKEKLWQISSINEWNEKMKQTLLELKRVLKSKGIIAFEIGKVRKNTIALEDIIIDIGKEINLNPIKLIINTQNFTKTSHCWGVSNNNKGTNSNIIVVFQK